MGRTRDATKSELNRCSRCLTDLCLKLPTQPNEVQPRGFRLPRGARRGRIQQSAWRSGASRSHPDHLGYRTTRLPSCPMGPQKDPDLRIRPYRSPRRPSPCPTGMSCGGRTRRPGRGGGSGADRPESFAIRRALKAISRFGLTDLRPSCAVGGSASSVASGTASQPQRPSRSFLHRNASCLGA